MDESISEEGIGRRSEETWLKVTLISGFVNRIYRKYQKQRLKNCEKVAENKILYLLGMNRVHGIQTI